MYIIGLIGALLVCVSYWMLQKGRWGPHSYLYLFANLAASFCLLASLTSPFQINNLGSIVLQLVMIGISIYGFTKARREKI